MIVTEIKCKIGSVIFRIYTNRVVRVRRIRIGIRKRKGIATPYRKMYAIGE